MVHNQPSAVVIIGSGIIGLTAALQLQTLLAQQHPSSSKGEEGIEIILVSREWPSSIPGAPPAHSVDYASMWAGAHVRPIPATTPQLVREAKWLKETVGVFERQVEEQKKGARSLGKALTKTLGIEILDGKDEGYERVDRARFEEETGLKGYRRWESEELPAGAVMGFEYETFCIDAPAYCRDLLRKFILQGGKTLARSLTSPWEAHTLHPKVLFVVNASGTGFGDPACFPTRGQTVLTDATHCTKTVTRQLADGTWSFIIPRGGDGGTIMGGTKQVGDWETGPCLETRERLLKNAEGLVRLAVEEDGEKSSGEVRVLADVVGRRPTREGGMRIEVEERGDESRVIHAYGAGGRGYEMCWGVAGEVGRLAERLLEDRMRVKSKL